MTLKVASKRDAVDAAPEMSAIVLENVSWTTFESLMRDLDGRRLRLTYDDGSLAIMAPISSLHERGKVLIRRMIELISIELEIPIVGVGSTTWKKRAILKAIEPDECFYVQHEAQIRGRFKIDLKRDPPPDLVLEVEVSHYPLDRNRVYAALGVREIWHFDGERLTALKLHGKNYRRIERSFAFPFLRPADLVRFVEMGKRTDDNTVMRAVRDWVRKLPRKK